MRTGLLSTSYPRHPHDFAGSFVAEMATWLAEVGDEVQVLAPAPAQSVHPGVTVTAIRYAGRPRLLYGSGAPDNLRDPRAWAQIPSFVSRLAWACHRQSHHWDAVISHWLLPCGLVAANCARGLPHLAVAHSSDVHLLALLPGASLLLQRLCRPRSALALTSASLRQPLLRLARDPASQRLVAAAPVIPMGITEEPQPSAAQRQQLRQRLGLAPDQLVVLFLGRLVPVKGVDRLLRATTCLPQVLPVVAGDGPERPALEGLARELGSPARFVGWQLGAEKAAWLAAADLLVLPTVVLADGRTDSAPLAVLEALAAGLPVVASQVGGLAELIQHEHNGLLVPAGDVAALRQAIVRLVDDPLLRRRCALAAAASAAPHRWQQVGPRLRQLLLAAAKGGQSTAAERVSSLPHKEASSC